MLTVASLLTEVGLEAKKTKGKKSRLEGGRGSEEPNRVVSTSRTAVEVDHEDIAVV